MIEITWNHFVSPCPVQAFAYVVPVLASVGSVLVGGIVTVIINSQTQALDALLESFNNSTRECLPSINSPEGGAVRSKPVLASEPGNVDTTVLDGPATAGENVRTEQGVSNGPISGSVGAVGLGDRLLLVMVLALSMLFAYSSALVGSSDLLGCFLGGVAFSSVPGVQKVWGRQVRVFLKQAACFGVMEPPWKLNPCTHYMFKSRPISD